MPPEMRRGRFGSNASGNLFESDAEALLTWPFLFRHLHRIWSDLCCSSRSAHKERQVLCQKIARLPASRAVSVQNKYCNNCLLDRRTPKRKQSCAQSHELVGQAMEQKLRRF